MAPFCPALGLEFLFLSVLCPSEKRQGLTFVLYLIILHPVHLLVPSPPQPAHSPSFLPSRPFTASHLTRSRNHVPAFPPRRSDEPLLFPVSPQSAPCTKQKPLPSPSLVHNVLKGHRKIYGITPSLRVSVVGPGRGVDGSEVGEGRKDGRVRKWQDHGGSWDGCDGCWIKVD